MDTKKFIVVMQELNAAEIPYDAIQTKAFGYASEGYNMGYLLQKLNNVLFAAGWSWETKLHNLDVKDGLPILYKISEIDVNGKLKPMISVYLTFSIKDEYQDIVFTSSSFGGCQLIGNSFGDSLKGAQTDALKKAISYTGLGGAAFRGNIDGQIRKFLFFRKELLSRLKDVLVSTYNMNEEKVTNSVICAYISKLLKKEFEKIEDVTETDFVKVVDLLEKSKKDKVEDEPKNKSRANKTSTSKTKSDKPIEEDSNPFEENTE